MARPRRWRNCFRARQGQPLRFLQLSVFKSAVQIRDIEDPRLVKALAHPLRIEILRVLSNRTASPSEIAEEIEARLPNVSYHVRFLERVGVIQLVKTRPRRGAVEHYYRARGRLRITDKVWAQVPDNVKSAMVDAALVQAINQITAAASLDGFARKESLASRRVMRLDEQGFKEVSAVFNQALEQVTKIEAESTRRLSSKHHELPEVRAGAVVTLFESAPVDSTVGREDHHNGSRSRRRRTSGSAGS